MNFKEYSAACKEGVAPRKYDNSSRKIQQSLKYNPDPKATVRHHLRDTEEQRKYNDEHYELWGFEIDENGNEIFNYGKYVVFVTKEEHTEIHKCSEETRKKIGYSSKQRWANSEYRLRCISSNKASWSISRRLALSVRFKGKKLSVEHRRKLSESKRGEKNPMYGKHPSAETLAKRSVAISAAMTPEVRQMISEHMPDRTGENNPMYGKPSPYRGCHHSDETRAKISANMKHALKDPSIREKLVIAGQLGGLITKDRATSYKQYKANGGTMTWNEFQKALKVARLATMRDSLDT